MKRALEILREGIERGATPGAVVCVRRGGRLLAHEALGTRDGVEPTTLDTLYDLASLTKPLATASTILSLVEYGALLLTDPAARYLGPIAAHRAPIQIRHLLTHTSGLPAWAPCYGDGPGLETAVATILALPAREPETRYEYSCLGYILLARIVEVVTGRTLDAVAEERVFLPHDLTSLQFRPGDSPLVAPTTAREGSEGRPVALRGTVHDGNARSIEAGGRSVSGNAGLFGTAADVAAFGEAIRAGGLFGAPTRTRWLTNQATPAGHTLGLFCHPNGLVPSGELLSDAAVGHSGYTGTALTIDPRHELTAVVLTNAVFGEGKEDWLRVRRRFFNALAAAL